VSGVNDRHDHAWTDRGRHDVEPEALLTSTIKPGEVNVCESPNRNFVDCVLSGTETAPTEVAHCSITICLLDNIAMRLGRKTLRWDPDKEQIVDDTEAAKLLSRPCGEPWTLAWVRSPSVPSSTGAGRQDVGAHDA
jgi:hypothetical protein